MNTFGFIAVVLLIFMNLACATFKKDAAYREAIHEIKVGNIDFAFLKLNNYLRENPDSSFASDIKFAIAEYYLGVKAYREATNQLSKYIIDYPQEENTVFAQVLLYKALTELNPDSSVIEKIKKNLFSQSLFLVFSDSKIKIYKSLLNNKYKIMDYIDRIEVFKNDEPIFEITP